MQRGRDTTCIQRTESRIQWFYGMAHQKWSVAASLCQTECGTAQAQMLETLDRCCRQWIESAGLLSWTLPGISLPNARGPFLENNLKFWHELELAIKSPSLPCIHEISVWTYCTGPRCSQTGSIACKLLTYVHCCRGSGHLWDTFLRD